MSSIMRTMHESAHDATMSHERPAWASSTIEPEDGNHEGHVTVGPVTLGLG